MRLNLSDEPVTAELLAEGLHRTGTARIAVNGSSMHPTLQMGWGIYLKPVEWTDLRPGDIAVFRTERNLTVHRLVWIETGPEGPILVFRGDYNRLRERVAPAAVVARVVAIEIPGRMRGMEKVVTLEGDALTFFYRASWLLHRTLSPILPHPTTAEEPPGWLGRAVRAVFAGVERALSFLLPQKR